MRMFQHDLDLATEQRRFEYQRRISEFDLFARARIDKYSALWSYVRVAHGRINELARDRKQEFSYLNDEDIDSYLERRGIPKGRRAEVLQGLADDRQAGMKLFAETLASYNVHDARAKWTEFNNHFVQNEFYFSDEVAKLSMKLISGMDELLVMLGEENTRHSPEAHVLNRETRKTMDALKSLLRGELEAGGPERHAEHSGNTSTGNA